MEREGLDFYATQSTVTDPGRMSGYLSDLPSDLRSLKQIARGLIIHYRGEDPAAHGIPDDRLAEIDTRYAESIIARLIELDDRPLAEERAPRERLVGCCRDFSVLFVTMVRSLGIPARARVGFGSYFDSGFNLDHEVADVWDSDERRWRLIDPELYDGHVDPNDGVPIDPLDVPRDRFLVGGHAWQLCRNGAADPATFLVDKHLEIEATRGWSQLRHNLVQDLAALNKAEMLLWDTWGLLEGEYLADQEHDLLDRLAAITAVETPAFADLQRIYEREQSLRVPSTVTSEDPLGGPPRTVVLR